MVRNNKNIQREKDEGKEDETQRLAKVRGRENKKTYVMYRGRGHYAVYTLQQ